MISLCKLFRKCNFNFELNSGILRINLIFSSGNCSQIFGKETSGWRSRFLVRMEGICRRSSSRSSTWSWSCLLILFVIQTSLNETGRKFWTWPCMNCTLKKYTRSLKGKILSFLKSGSVWALYLDLQIRRIAAFCLRISGLKLLELVHDQMWIA